MTNQLFTAGKKYSATLECMFMLINGYTLKLPYSYDV